MKDKFYIFLLAVLLFLYTMGISFLTIKLMQFLFSVGG